MWVQIPPRALVERLSEKLEGEEPPQAKYSSGASKVPRVTRVPRQITVYRKGALGTLRKKAGLERGVKARIETGVHTVFGYAVARDLRFIKSYLEIAGVKEIARRYFVINAFDGVLTILGVILGSYAISVKNPSIIVSAGLGGCIAMGLSGFVGTLLAEQAEQQQRIRTLEIAMGGVDLSNSLVDKVGTYASVVVALIDGTAPMIASIPPILPFYMSMRGGFSIAKAYLTSIPAAISELIMLGILLGHVSRGSKVKYGLITGGAGVLLSALLLLLGVG